MKHISIIWAHGVMQYWGVNYWETYAPLENWISVGSLLAIASIYELPIISIDFVTEFPQAGLDVDVFVEIHLGM